MDDIITWLQSLIGFNTTSLGDGAESCVRYIQETLSARGVTVRTFTTEGDPRRAHHLLAEVQGDSPETAMLHAHLDTAEYGSRSDWRFPPDRSSHIGGCIFGRGAIDCKGPLAVWMKLLTDAAESKRRPYSLRLLVTDLEEQGCQTGLGLLLAQHPEILSDVNLVIGEGGGFPFPFDGFLYYTFQTGERDEETAPPDKSPTDDLTGEKIREILSLGVRKGYYSRDILAYADRYSSLRGRRMDIRPLYEGMEAFFRAAPDTQVYERYAPCVEKALKKIIPNARLMPCITPGSSDNRFFRNAGIPVIGFFPLDIGNYLRGIHGVDEYISEGSLRLAYGVMSRVLKTLSF